MKRRTHLDIPRLQDNSGKSYVLDFYENESTWIVKTFDGHVLVAQVNCLIRQDALFIGDLHIFDNVPVRESLLGGLFRSALCLKSRTRNYQGMGLGTRLLRMVVEKAKEQKLSRVFGNLFPKDLTANPRLPNWYEAQGFSVEMHHNGQSGTVSLFLR